MSSQGRNSNSLSPRTELSRYDVFTVVATAIGLHNVELTNIDPDLSRSIGKRAALSLPFEPRLTPAIAVAGTLLLLVGSYINLFAIWRRWLQIYFSVSLLGSLCVAILLLYLENPPISNAIEGAYLVAAVMSGQILGVGALLFQEVTEGLGSLLGGFCLSMWLLTLKAGGLVTSESAKVLLIVAFTLAAFSTSLTAYTKAYGIVGCTAFSGATAIVLGIDCFTRAGLKEFWLYIWALNDQIISTSTQTYPLTRGIIVELALIPVIWIIGLLSQIKIKRTYEKECHAAMGIDLILDEERQVHQNELEHDRRLMRQASEERLRWETVYGDPRLRHLYKKVLSKTIPNFSRKPSFNVETREFILSTPLTSRDTSQTRSRDGNGDDGVNTSSGKFLTSRDGVDGFEEAELHHPEAISVSPTEGPFEAPETGSRLAQIWVSDASAIPGRTLLPLSAGSDFYTQYTSGLDDVALAQANDTHPVAATFGTPIDGPHINPKQGHERQIQPYFDSGASSPGVKSDAELGAPSEADSSMAATLDEHEHYMDLRLQGTASGGNSEKGCDEDMHLEHGSVEQDLGNREIKIDSLSSPTSDDLGLAKSSGPMPEVPLTTEVLGQLPNLSSSSIIAHRTIEWAKHLELADDSLSTRSSSRASSIVGNQREVVAPVLLNELKQTATSAPIHSQRLTYVPPHEQQAQRKTDEIAAWVARTEPQSVLQDAQPGHPTSSMPLHTTEYPGVSPSFPGSRASDLEVQDDDSLRYVRRGQPESGLTLLAQRQGKLKELASRPSLASLPSSNHVPSPTEWLLARKRASGGSAPKVPSRLSFEVFDDINEDDMPLSRRRDFLRQQKREVEYKRARALSLQHQKRSYSSTTSSSTSATNPSKKSAPANMPHPKSRHFSDPAATNIARDTVLASFHTSLSKDGSPNQKTTTSPPPPPPPFDPRPRAVTSLTPTKYTDIALESRRAEMIAAREQKSRERERRSLEMRYRQETMELAMRMQPSMQEAHRNAMRKMQAVANRHISA